MSKQTDIKLAKSPEDSLNGFINTLLDDIEDNEAKKQESRGFNPALNTLGDLEARREDFTANVQNTIENLITYFDHRIESDQPFENSHLENWVKRNAKELQIDLNDDKTLNLIIKLLVAKLPTSE